MFHADAGSIRLTVLRMERVGVAEKAAAVAAVGAAGHVLEALVRAHVSLRDHKSDDLANLDHPYARRHGQVKRAKLKHARSRYFDRYQDFVHQQSGALARSVGTVSSTARASVRVGFVINPPAHARAIVYGTRVMLPRDPVVETANAKATRVAMMRAVVTAFGAVMRAKAAVRFETTAVPIGPSRGG